MNNNAENKWIWTGKRWINNSGSGSGQISYSDIVKMVEEIERTYPKYVSPEQLKAEREQMLNELFGEEE